MHSRRDGILDGAGDDNAGNQSKNAWALDGGIGGVPSRRSAARWLRHMFWPTKSSSDPPKPLRPTAYLDGMRGLAALLVYIHHHELWAHGAHNLKQAIALENAFGWRGDYYFATVVGIRTFFSGGHFAVGIFYVLSGYVLCAKPLALIQSGELLKLGDVLASSFFRRWFRLYVPLILVTFVQVTSWHAFGGWWNYGCEPKGSLGEEWWNWYTEFKNFSFLFKEGPIWVTYNYHLWSIPLEMRGSVIVFMACMAMSRATTRARLLCELAMMWYFMYVVDGYYGSLFMAGMLQCDLDLLARRPDGYFPKFLRKLEPYKTFIYYHLLVIGLWLGGIPAQTTNVMDLRANPGWYWMSFLKPQAPYDYKWFFLFIAANSTVASTARIGWLRRFFEGRFCQYLAHISFALYMVHGPILATLGDRVYHAVGFVRTEKAEMMVYWANMFPLPKTGPFGLEFAFLVPQIILLPFTFWVAGLVTRLVDEPSVRFAAWLYKRTLGGAALEEKTAGSPLLRLA